MPVASTSTASPPPLPALTPIADSLLACRFSSWYPALRKVSPKATIIDVESIQPDFYDWLEEDGLILPLGSGEGVIGGEVESRSSLEFDQDAGGAGDEERNGADPHDDSDSDSDSGSEGSEYQARDFSRLDEKIREVIEKYGGDVFPKLDWSAPRDAAWILPGQTLKCTTPADVYLLLKSSDFISKDVMQAQELQNGVDAAANGTGQPTDAGGDLPEAELASLSLSTAPASETADPTTSGTASPRGKVNLNLVLKRHFAVNPSHEFRCFVRAGTFVAIAQRDGTYYDFLQPKPTQKDVRQKLYDFWNDNLRERLGTSTSASGTPLQDYVFDAYFTKDRSRVFLMDVNPYLPRTDALLWDWDELEEHAQRIRDRQWKERNGITVEDEDDEEDDEEDDDDDDDEGADSEHGSQGEDDDAEGSYEAPHTDPPGQESFMRIYLDGSRPPELLTRPTTDSDSQSPPRPRLPTLRLADNDPQSCRGGGGGSSLTSGGSSRGGPTYASNMMPRDVLDVSSGRGIEEFARIWKEEVEKAS